MRARTTFAPIPDGKAAPARIRARIAARAGAIFSTFTTHLKGFHSGAKLDKIIVGVRPEGIKRQVRSAGVSARTRAWGGIQPLSADLERLAKAGGVVFENTPLARRQWTGLDDEHLASIGFVNFAWNALERKFASLVWVTAGWTQEVGDLVVAGMGNVSLVTLYVNLLKQELKVQDDRRLWEQGANTGVLFDAIRDARNDVVHTFFDCDTRSGAQGHFKGSPRKSRTGHAEIRTVAMGKTDIDDLCCAISDCFESINDLILKLWFRRRFLAADHPAPAHSYDRAVHDWRNPPFDVGRLAIYPRKRAQGAGALQGRRPDPSQAETRSGAGRKPIAGKRAAPSAAETPASPTKERALPSVSAENERAV